MSFHDIYGHERQKEILKKTLAQKRVGHAYLFSGTNAVGKRALAGEFATALNCEKADILKDSCNQCPSCIKIRHASHADLIFVKADRQFIRIDAVREIQERMKFRPLEGRWRTVIIDEADKMNDHAANALLKTLEEPSASNVLILISARPYSMLPTIISRCRHMRFNPLPVTEVRRYLMEQKGIDQQKSAMLAGLSGGSIGLALELDEEDVYALRTELIKLLLNAKNGNPISLLNLASNLGHDKKKIKQGLDIINSFFRDALIFKETRRNDMLINADKSSFVDLLAGNLSGSQILQNISLVSKAWETIELNVNKTLTLETMAFKLNF
jgi:DNA polymerase-3 subunit delta'